MEDTLFQIISAVLGLVAVFLGGFWLKAKGKLSQLATVLKEGQDIITAVHDALLDDKFTKEERDIVRKEYDEFIKALRQLISW
jgi:uncharacterized protein YgfB (UPF0149 family)